MTKHGYDRARVSWRSERSGVTGVDVPEDSGVNYVCARSRQMRYMAKVSGVGTLLVSAQHREHRGGGEGGEASSGLSGPSGIERSLVRTQLEVDVHRRVSRLDDRNACYCRLCG
jgi:hypothetical protein